MNGLVAQPLQVEKEIRDLARQDRPHAQRAQYVVEGDIVGRQEAVASGDLFGKELAKLAQLD